MTDTIKRSSTVRVVPFVLTATFLWALAGTAVATVPDLSVAAIAFGGGTALLIAGAFRSDRSVLLSTLRANLGFVAIVAALDVVNFVGYYGALRLGPTPIIAALHLSSPVIVMAWYLIRRRRKFDWTVAVQIVLVAAALLLLAIGRESAVAETAHGSDGILLLACVLSLTTAFALAAMNLIVGHSTLAHSREFGIGAQLLCVSAVVSGIELVDTNSSPSIGPIVVSLLLGAACTAPATLLIWKSLAQADVTFVSTLSLTEAIWTVGMVAVITSRLPGMLSLIAGAIILLAATVEVRFGSRCGAGKTPEREQLHRRSADAPIA